MPTLLFALVFVAMMGLRSQATHMLIFTYILILVNCICGCFSMILAIIHSNVAAATIKSNLFILISCLFGGLVVYTAATPTFLAWMRSISYFYYSFQEYFGAYFLFQIYFHLHLVLIITIFL